MDWVHGVGLAVERPTTNSDPSESSSDEPQRPGVLLGEFRLVREIGRGGMGVVYEAVQEPLGRPVALKILPAIGRRSDQAVERFHREAQLAARLHHTHIVPVFAVGEHLGLHYFAMQYIRGQSLDQWLHALRANRRSDDTTLETTRESTTAQLSPQPSADEATPPNATAEGAEPNCCDLPSPGSVDYFRHMARIGMQAARALHYAHGQGILHRDIKPGNLLLDERGDVWLTDFGLARADQSDDLTRTGEVPGTLRFLAPERLQGQADARSDVYSLGLTLYEAATLQPAFGQGERAQLLDQIVHQAPRWPREIEPRIPPDLETIILKCVAKSPELRYPNAGELAEDLQRFLAGEPICARRASLVERWWRWSRRNRPLAAALAGAALLLVIASTISSVFAYREYVNGKRIAFEKQQTTEALNQVQATASELRQTNDSAAKLSLRPPKWP
jgi:serine/threonine protein kinase